MNARLLYDMTAPSLCACGERLEDDFERRNGVCYFCMADAAESAPERDEVRAELAERHNARSRHFHRRMP